MESQVKKGIYYATLLALVMILMFGLGAKYGFEKEKSICNEFIYENYGNPYLLNDADYDYLASSDIDELD